MDQWVDFFSMWEHNEGLMNVSCSAIFNGTRDNSMTENLDILEAIGAESDKMGVDRRFNLAIIMQESKGCVRAQTTSSPGEDVTNPGLMQTHDGLGTCAGTENRTTPCGPVMIRQMVKDGVQGTAGGDGLKQCWDTSPGSGAAQYYAAARMYNSGAIDGSGDLGAGCCTHCYASDVANRLTGWVNATSPCTLDNDS
ncbi:hypothetical protein EJ03DRAFT_322057 [Teratosphaeria nubilosa]|uniref:Transglycosylase SLT domain-containing protein n=1 Tax=Teratosphaeria nubilosa TaxID=161662 RepID=A0A6G1KV93_9PEZI|nr:hypothetical protein EJ03DRAFT_322057 [Teratosphaeria nubilosa]